MRNNITSGLAHTAAWAFFLGSPFIFFYEDQKFELSSVLTSPYYYLFAFSFAALFYGNFYYLIPNFYLKKQYGRYALTLFLLFIGFYFLKPFILMFRYYVMERKIDLPEYPPLKPDTMSCIIFVIVISTGIAVQVVRQWRATEKRALQAETEKANAELSFLKAQINPHFLFNTLNNIYSLSVDQHPDTSASIMKLSNIMRYITDDANHDFVPLDSELTCIRDFIDLHRLRHGDNVKLDFTVTGNTETKEIAPLVLMTYIENVFKYGISSREEAIITINVAAEADRITFFCQNRIFPTPGVRESTGIGQKNTKRRLEHLYPHRHDLSISSKNDLYTVELSLMT